MSAEDFMGASAFGQKRPFGLSRKWRVTGINVKGQGMHILSLQYLMPELRA